MNKLYLIALLLLTIKAHSQSPQLIPYQAVARDAGGVPISTTNLLARFTIHDQAANGNVVWQELQTVTTDILGLFTIQLGNSVPLSGVNWAAGDKFMQVELDLGNGYIDLGSSKLLSVPYALYSTNSLNSENAVHSNYSENSGNGFSHISAFGDTLYLENSTAIIIPGLSSANSQGNNSFGCTNPMACNYNASASIDNGSCRIIGNPCNDNNSLTVNDVWSVECTCAGTLISNSSEHSCGAPNVHNGSLNYGTVSDMDGNTYKTILIGEQEWMAEDLRSRHYQNGEVIPHVLDGPDWNSSPSPATCWYANDSAFFNCPYGKLYNLYAVTDSRNICPQNWHVPTDAEWMQLEVALGMPLNEVYQGGTTRGANANIAGKLKSIGTQAAGTGYWTDANTVATNESGFSSLPGGATGGVSIQYGGAAYYWTSSYYGPDTGFMRNIGYNDYPGFPRGILGANNGYSVRCIRD
jgi:uncharacterized protein (TIGR02145 family)